MQKQKQFNFFEEKIPLHFGGEFLKNSNAKNQRPLSFKRPIHLVMRSTLAKGSLSLLKFDGSVRKIFERQSKKFGVKIYRFANAGNHLHLIIFPRSRQAYRSFIRSVTGLVARLVLRVQRGKSKKPRFWDKRPFTRIANWGKDFRGLCNYLLRNTLEAIGFIPYKPRITRGPPKVAMSA